MPVYAYRCEKCGQETEVMQSMTDPPLRRCPNCKSIRLRRLFHPIGIVLKGPGFHKTDSRRSRPSDEKKPDSKTDSKTESKSSESKSSESKSSESKSSESKKPDKK